MLTGKEKKEFSGKLFQIKSSDCMRLARISTIRSQTRLKNAAILTEQRFHFNALNALHVLKSARRAVFAAT